MGSRARSAAAACLVASGLLVGGLGAAPAFADPGSAANDDSVDGYPDASPRPTRPHGTGKHTVERGEAEDPSATPDDSEAEPGRDVPEEPTPDGGGDGLPGQGEDPVEDPAGEGDEVDPGGEGEEIPRPPCCKEGDEDCGPGWPWPWPWPENPDQPPVPDRDSDNDTDKPPVGMPPTVPRAPIVGGASDPGVLDVLPGFDISANDVRNAPISVPMFVPAPVGVGPAVVPGAVPGVGPGGGPGTATGVPGAGPPAPAAPRQVSTSPPPASQPLPAAAGSSVAMPSGSRVGYGEYLRAAGISQIAALALPGLAGILVLTGAGGLMGYRQAKAGQGVRSSGIARFMN